MQVFITGGTGYIGQATIKALTAAGHSVTALVRDQPDRVTRLGATPVIGTLADTSVLRDAAKRADGVIHLAVARDGDAVAIDRAAQAAMQDGPGRFVDTGGTWAYGDTDGLIDETAPFKVLDFMAWRLANEELVLGRGGVVVLPGLVYGDNTGLIEQFYARTPVPYIGTGENRWSLVHVDDIASLYVLALRAAPGSVYIGVGDVHPTQREVASALARRLGTTTESVDRERAREWMGPLADAFALDQTLSSAKAETELRWRPKHDDPLGEIESSTQA
ncbi:NAD-dependent epimerase/dehydratase family protein [Kibdelosporangium lantanae]